MVTKLEDQIKKNSWDTNMVKPSESSPVFIKYSKDKEGNFEISMPSEVEYLASIYPYDFRRTETIDRHFDIKPVVLSEKQQNEITSELLNNTKDFVMNHKGGSEALEDYRQSVFKSNEYEEGYKSFINEYIEVGKLKHTSSDAYDNLEALYNIYNNPKLGDENRAEIQGYIDNCIKRRHRDDAKKGDDVKKPEIDLSKDANPILKALNKKGLDKKSAEMLAQIDNSLDMISKYPNKYGNLDVDIFLAKQPFEKATENLRSADVGKEITEYQQKSEALQEKFNNVAVPSYKAALGLRVSYNAYRANKEQTADEFIAGEKETLIKDTERRKNYVSERRKAIAKEDLAARGVLGTPSSMSTEVKEGTKLSKETVAAYNKVDKSY